MGNKQGISLPSPLGEGLGVRPRGVGARLIGTGSKAERGRAEAERGRVCFLQSLTFTHNKKQGSDETHSFHRCLAMSLSEAVAATYFP